MTSHLGWLAYAAGFIVGSLSVMVSERTAGELQLLRPAGARPVAYGAVSVIVGLLYLLGALRFGTTPLLLAWCWACSLGLSLILTDLAFRRLPFSLVAALAIGCFAAFLTAAIIDGQGSRLVFACEVAAAMFTVAALLQFALPEHTGGGDTALYGALALYLGWFSWTGLLQGFLLASGLTAVVALVVAVRSGRARVRFPAGPSLIVGALASVLIR
ncbi:hypothetical protein GCM10022222_86170 [Amycolatopsis ultiminotia]|uniref:Leader peptidase (Prepilin peptidase) / N-methyltransferase n=1 Tax=Amycolatopsis ultiminotia TaxID=543629 RepID=A0ABP6YQU7_9PSEU